MIEGNDERATYYLNEEQFELINNDLRPLFLFGSAGSGKTTIAINKAYSLCRDNIEKSIRIGYFTYSGFLVDEAKNVFKRIVREEGERIDKYNSNINFYSVNKYLLKVAKKTSMVSYDEFKLWLSNYLNKNINKVVSKIQCIDLWREIRGIIKGLVHIDSMNIEIPTEKLTEEFVEYLMSNGLATLEVSKLCIKGEDIANVNTKVNYYGRNKDEFIKNLDIIYDVIDDILCSTKIMSRELYLSLKEEYSIFSVKDREFIYDISIKYQQWLDSNNKIDENDAVKFALNRLRKRDYDKFDYIICDEIQDLSELQIYYLFKIVKNKENLFFCGDYNQTINPTFFDTGRIEAIFKKYNGIFKFENRIIKTNYRSSKNIVEFSKKLTELKKNTILKNKKSNRYDYEEQSIRDNDRKITLIDAKAISMENLLDITKRRAYVDVLVADEEEKEKLLSCGSNNKLVFSVSNYKGLENEYIIGYNIISKFKEKWREILSGSFKSTETELKYYFNLFYVFITRARENVCLIEEDVNEELLEYFKDKLEVLEEFDIAKMNLERISNNDDHYKRALSFEKMEKYAEAIEAYKNADINSIELDRSVKRCMALSKYKQGYYLEAGHDLMRLREYGHAFQCYLSGEDYLNAIQAKVLNRDNYEEISQSLNKVGIDPLVVIKENSNVPWINKFNKIYKEHMDCNLIKLNGYVLEIEEIIRNLKR